MESDADWLDRKRRETLMLVLILMLLPFILTIILILFAGKYELL